MANPIKVLVVDDSAMVREILSQGLSQDPGIAVVDTARDAYDARDKIVKYRPDVLTLDIEMPRMDGVEFLRRLMPQYPLPVVVVSSLTARGRKITMDALESGAVDFVTKPRSDVSRGLQNMMQQLRTKVKIASAANVSHWKDRRSHSATVLRGPQALSESTDKVIVIGASTGGTEAIKAIITRLPRMCPGVVVVQHMPAGFTRMFAERVDSLSDMNVKEAENGDRILQGQVLVAPGGDRHLQIRRSGGQYRVELIAREKVCGHRPSVEVLMQSAAVHVGSNAIGIMLTGMGSDGADGMLAMRKAGARTLAQDEASCVVYGMPKEAFERGGAEKLVPLYDIPAHILSWLEEKHK